ncbi:MAG: hypothetical protein HRU20_23360 [Pseudomonadales bacterium]|nr:hypothetical protein [Pseudomonadales bacterium]
MTFSLVTIVLLLVAAVSIVLAVRVLMGGNWIVGFVRGNTGLILLLGATFLALAAINIATYSSAGQLKVIANVSFKKLDVQSYQVEVTDTDSGELYKVNVEGDLWSISTRQLVIILNSKKFYQLSHVEGRFYDIEQQKKAGNVHQAFPNDEMGIDLWSQFHNRYSPIINASVQSSAFIPLADEALFSVSVSDHGLKVQAINTSAKAAVKN